MTAPQSASLCSQNELELYLRTYHHERPALVALTEQLKDEPEQILHRSNMRGHITCSAAVLNHTFTKILLIHHGVYKTWLQPGGHYEAPGSLFDSAKREVTEETGVAQLYAIMTTQFGSLLDVDTHPIAANAKKNEGAHFHHDFLYLLQAGQDSPLVAQLEEVSAAKWVELAEFYAMPGARVQRVSHKLKQLLVQLPAVA